jgi:hypothetical protein
MLFENCLHFLSGKKRFQHQQSTQHLFVSGYKVFAWIFFIAILIWQVLYHVLLIDTSECVKYTGYATAVIGSCVMLACFGRLASGFLKVPLSALLVLLFYSAVQPIFFAEEELSTAIPAPQILFIINFICLMCKFALIFIIRWLFSEHRISYFFMSEQINKNCAIKDAKVKDLFSEKSNNRSSAL